MAQQSDTEPRKAEKRQGKLTREWQKRIINRQEIIKGTDVPVPGESLQQAGQRHPAPGTGIEYEISHGRREILRGANDESRYRKRRTED